MTMPPRFLRLRETDPIPIRLLKGGLYALLTADVVYLSYAGSWAPALISLAPLLAGAAVAFVADRPRRVFQRRVRRGVCTRCEYDLRGCPSVDNVEPRVGPIVCPECGAAWPLVPPPAPG